MTRTTEEKRQETREKIIFAACELFSQHGYHDTQVRVVTIHDTLTSVFDYVDQNPQQLLMLLRGSFGVDKELNISVWNHFRGSAEDVAEDVQGWMKG